MQFFVNDAKKPAGVDPQPPAGNPETVQMVTDQYKTALRREPDAGGLNNWVGAAQSRLDAGQSKEQVNTRNLNSFADQRDFDGITYRINGGYNCKASRDDYYAQALEVLGA